MGMDQDIENAIQNCEACAATRPLDFFNTPLQPVSFPAGPWLKGAVDISGPIDNKYLVTFIDYYSLFPDVQMTKDIGSKSIVIILSNMFGRHCYSEETPASLLVNREKHSASFYFDVGCFSRHKCIINQMYIRNVKYLTLVPINSKTLFDDVDEESKEINKEIVVDSCEAPNMTIDQSSVVRTQSGCTMVGCYAIWSRKRGRHFIQRCCCRVYNNGVV